MRVLLVHNRYRSEGGEERHIDLLEEWLPKVGVQVSRLDVSSPRDPSFLERLRMGLTLTYRPAGAALLRSALQRVKPDVVHFHNIFPLLTPAAMRAVHRHGTPVVLTVHNYRFACPAGTLVRNGRIHEDCVTGSSLLCGLRNSRGVLSESLAYGVAIELQRRLRMLCRWVDAYVAPSAFAANMLARAGYPSNRIHTIQHGTPIDDEPSGVGDFALYVGRLSHEKGVETLIEASRLAPHVPLVLAGEGPLAPLVHSLPLETATYLGQLEPKKVAEVRRQARFTVAPSNCYEVQPFGVLESLASGTPVVASGLGGMREIVIDGVTGLLIPPADPTALAGAMAMMWSDNARVAEMGVAAANFAREQFSPEKQASHLSDLYERTRARTRPLPRASKWFKNGSPEPSNRQTAV